jgi:hypothetical protein
LGLSYLHTKNEEGITMSEIKKTDLPFGCVPSAFEIGQKVTKADSRSYKKRAVNKAFKRFRFNAEAKALVLIDVGDEQ